RPDIAVADPIVPRIRILWGAGGRSFTLGGFDTPAATHADVVAVDWNEDGVVDMVTSDIGPGTVSLFLRLGDGAFEAPRQAAVGSELRELALVDFDHDGDVDVAVADYGADAAGSVPVLLNDGRGGFREISYESAGLGPLRLAVDDFDRNGWPDLAVSLPSLD